MFPGCLFTENLISGNAEGVIKMEKSSNRIKHWRIIVCDNSVSLSITPLNTLLMNTIYG